MAMATHLCTYSPITTKITNKPLSPLSPVLNPRTCATRHPSFVVRTPASISPNSGPSVSAWAATTSIKFGEPATSIKPSKSLPFRVGHGFDLHRLEPGYPLIIGGINNPHDRGCEAHSDGDVLLHCVVDAILGALGLPDIGQIFPDSDPKWKGAPSSVFIKEAVRLMHEAGYKIDSPKTKTEPAQGSYEGQFVRAARSRSLCCKSKSENSREGR